jgi:hypothetical protein
MILLEFNYLRVLIRRRTKSIPSFPCARGELICNEETQLLRCMHCWLPPQSFRSVGSHEQPCQRDNIDHRRRHIDAVFWFRRFDWRDV